MKLRLSLLAAILVLCTCTSALGKEPKAPPKKSPKLIENKTFKGMAGAALRLENEEDVTIRGCKFLDVGIAIRLINCRRITIDACVMADLTIMGIDVRGGCSDIRISNNRMLGFRANAQGGHFISTEKTAKPQQFRITIKGNTLTGNGKSWVSGRMNGAAGDMIALRSVVGFTMSDNHLSGGGEFGMDCLYGCENGVIARNRIHRIDGTGILIGYGVKNINVHGNNLVDCGSSFETDGSTNDITHQSGIHCRGGVENVLITSNLIVRENAPEMRYGIHLRETTGVIQGNLFAGVGEEIHVPRSLVGTVKIKRP